MKLMKLDDDHDEEEEGNEDMLSMNKKALQHYVR